MSAKQNVAHLTAELNKLIDRFRSEYEMTYAEVVGTLQVKCWELCKEADEETKADW